MIKKNITYSRFSASKNLLDVIYTPGQNKLPVIFFIHGGSWMSGSKDMYTKLGTSFLKKGYVSVIISYRLFPETDVFGMAEDCKAALKWCIKNIEQFGGDPEGIYMTGHSAGGHLAAVAGLSQTDPSANIAGFICIDAFGLSAHHFLTGHAMFIPEFFTGIFGNKQEQWPLVSPDKLIKKGVPPFLLLTGGNTYPVLSYDNENFRNKLQELGIACTTKIIQQQSHMQMIYLFEDPENKVFRIVEEWMDSIN